MTCGIYCIENKTDGKCYIGQAKDFDKRIYHHKWNWKKETYEETSGENRPLWYTIKKHGENNFNIFMIVECNKEDLNYLETFYIKKFESLSSQKGYNILSDGFSREGIHHSQETKNKISSANKGKKRSQETREKISRSRMGFKPSPESVQKMRNSKKGKTVGPVPSFLGKLHTEETKKKQSDARKRYWNAKKNLC
jgi:group I intron endonuclease